MIKVTEALQGSLPAQLRPRKTRRTNSTDDRRWRCWAKRAVLMKKKLERTTLLLLQSRPVASNSTEDDSDFTTGARGGTRSSVGSQHLFFTTGAQRGAQTRSQHKLFTLYT